MKERGKMTDDSIDVEAAWERFMRRVEHEPVPEAWRQRETPPILADGANSGAAEASPDAQAARELSGLAAVQGEAELADALHGSREPNQTAERKRRLRLYRWKQLGTAGAAAAVLGIMLFTPLGDRALAALLQTFRIEHLQTVSVTNSEISRLEAALQDGTSGTERFDLRNFGTVEEQGGGPAQSLTAAEAAARTGYPAKRIPGSDKAQPVSLHPQSQITLKLHTRPINKLIRHVGGTSRLPESADGKPITLFIPATIETQYKSESEDSQGKATASVGQPTSKQLLQVQAPEIGVPEGVDVDQVRKAVLDLPLLPDSLRDKLAGIEDWRHTLPVPVIDGKGVETTVNGYEAVVYSNEQSRALLWLQDGWIYQLTGTLADYPTAAALLGEAKEIMAQ